MVDGEPADIAKTCGNRYQILADLYILLIYPYSPVMAPGAIQLAKSAALTDPDNEDGHSDDVRRGCRLTSVRALNRAIPHRAL